MELFSLIFVGLISVDTHGVEANGDNNYLLLKNNTYISITTKEELPHAMQLKAELLCFRSNNMNYCDVVHMKVNGKTIKAL